MPARTLSPLLPFPKIGKVWRRHRSSSPHPEAQPLLDHPPEEARPNGFLDWKYAQRYHWAKLPEIVDHGLYPVNYAIVPKLLQAEHTKSGNFPQPGAKNFAATPVPPRPPRAVISPLYSIPRRSTFNLARGSKTRLRANRPMIVQIHKDHPAYQSKPFLPTSLSPIKEDHEKEQFSYDAPRRPPGLHGIKEEPDKEQIGFPQQSDDASQELAGMINPFDDLFASEYEEINLADISFLEDDFPSVSDDVNAGGIHELILKEVVGSKMVKILSDQSRHAEQVVEYSG